MLKGQQNLETKIMKTMAFNWREIFQETIVDLAHKHATFAGLCRVEHFMLLLLHFDPDIPICKSSNSAPRQILCSFYLPLSIKKKTKTTTTLWTFFWKRRFCFRLKQSLLKKSSYLNWIELNDLMFRKNTCSISRSYNKICV